MLRRIALVLFAAACVCPGLAGRQDSTQPKFRAGVDLVRLDVSVLDRDRRPVRGLTADDFIVLEDGQPRPVVTFAEVNVPDAGARPEGWLRDVAPDVATNQSDVRRIVVIVMDDASTEYNPGASETAKQIARAVIDRLGPNDLAAVVFTYQGRSQDFTSDRRQLMAATETFMPRTRYASSVFNAGGGLDASARTGNRLGAQMSVVGDGPPCAGRGLGTCLTDTLETVAAALEKTTAGRKSIVLIGPDAWSTWDWPPSSFAGPTRAASFDSLRWTVASLQVANTNVYAFDPTGLSGDGVVSKRLDALRQFAENTGGRATYSTNAPWEGVPQVFAENSSYYLLGIQPGDSPQDGRFRQVAVTVRKPDVDVRTRSGYFSRESIRRRADRTLGPISGLDSAFGAALPSGSLPMAVAAAPFALPGGKQSTIAVSVETERPPSDSATVERLEVLTAAFDSGFKERSTDRQTVDMRRGPDVAGGVELQSRLTLPPGRYEIRVAAAAAQDAGAVFTQIDIPDFSKPGVSFSGLVLGRPRGDGADALADLVPVRPTTDRAFKPGEPVTAFLRVYQGGKAALRSVPLRARILDAADRTVFEETRDVSAAQFASARAADYRLDLPLQRLGAGEHLLIVEAGDQKATVRRDLRFAVDRE